MQVASAALVGGLGEGIATAAGSAAGAGVASISAGQLNLLSNSIAASSPTGNADMDRTLGNIVANVVATGAGAAVGGGDAGPFAGYNIDRFNRQLHVDGQANEKTLAKQLADKSGGKYTQAQVEDQLRIMGGLIDGSHESGAPTTLIGQAPTDTGAQWQYAGKTDDGKPILTQITAQPNPALQSYILANSASVSAGAVPGIVYDPTGKKGFSVDVTGPFTKFDQSDANYVRNTTADASAMISTNAGRFTAATAAAAAIPSPYSAGFAAAAYGATVVGIGADALAQMVKPNVGQYAISGVTGLIVGNVSDRFPLLSPAINETAITFNNSGSAQKAQNSLNDYWSKFANYWSGKR